MTKLRTDKKTHTFRGAAAFITAAFLVMLFTGCPNANGNKPTPSSKYMVTFSVDGSNGNFTAAVDGKTITSGTEVEKGKKVTFTAAPADNFVVDNWTIQGGSFESGTGMDGNTTAKVKVTAAVTITVSFKAKPAGTVTYKVEHWQQNVTGNDYTKKEEETKTGKPDETTQAAAKTYEGFTAKAVTQQTIKADGSTVVRIDYDRNLITLTLNLDGGSTTTSLTDGNKLKGRFGADVPAVSDPTKTGCAFKDWKPELPAKFPAQDGTYTAQWEKNKYTVTFDAKDGSPTPAAQTVPYKEKASAPSPVPAKEGHTLEGWYNKEGNTPWDFAVNEVTKNTELYAQWKINEYAVTFSVEGTPANGELKAMAGSTEITSGKKVPYGTTVTFTATVTAGEHYVDEWTIKGGSFKTGGADGDTTATVQIK